MHQQQVLNFDVNNFVCSFLYHAELRSTPSKYYVVYIGLGEVEKFRFSNERKEVTSIKHNKSSVRHIRRFCLPLH